MPRYQSIFYKFARANLNVIAHKLMRITLKHLRGLYGHVPLDVFEKLKRQMLGKEVLIAVVEDENALERVVELCGDKTAPAECAEHTIRYEFGSHKEGENHINAVHRAKTPEEAKAQLALFGFD